MTIHEPGIYHIYNRGNNQQPVFFSEENYYYFLRKCHQYLAPFSDILAWCLMPNHFHFLISIDSKGTELIKCGALQIPVITNGFRLLQSSYAKGINRERNTSGNLFQQKTKSKRIDTSSDYRITAFHYIHQNPVSAGLVKVPEEWPYSSFRDYLNQRNGRLCNKEKAIELLGLNKLDLATVTIQPIKKEQIAMLY